MNVGRNDLCPCGSGKKYKKCCLGKETETKSVAGSTSLHTPAAMSWNAEKAGKKAVARSVDDDDLIAPGEIGDYGDPDLSQEFFDANPLEAISAQRIAWNMAKSP